MLHTLILFIILNYLLLLRMVSAINNIILIMNYNNLHRIYLSLLEQAELTSNRKECLSIIHQADAIRQEMNNHPEGSYHPTIYG